MGLPPHHHHLHSCTGIQVVVVVGFEEDTRRGMGGGVGGEWRVIRDRRWS